MQDVIERYMEVYRLSEIHKFSLQAYLGLYVGPLLVYIHVEVCTCTKKVAGRLIIFFFGGGGLIMGERLGASAPPPLLLPALAKSLQTDQTNSFSNL